MSTTKTWPGGAVNSTPTAYTIPAAGELNWATLSNFLNALGDSAQSTTIQKFAVRKAVASPITVSASTDCVIESNLTVAGAVAVTLPAGANKQVFFVVDDKGDCGTNNITITPNGADTIIGAATLVMTVNREYVGLIYDSASTDWKIVCRGSGAGSPLNNPMTTIGDMIYGGASGTPLRLPAGTAETWLVSKGGAAPQWLNTVTTGKFIDGSADEIQSRVQAHSAQTLDIVSYEKSDATKYFSLSAAGITRPARGIETTDLSTEDVTVASGKTLFHPYMTIDTGVTYTINGTFVSVGVHTVNGTKIVNGTSQVL